MKDLIVSKLSPDDASYLSELLTGDIEDYKQYFIPFSAEYNSLKKRLESVKMDRYWGLWFKDTLAGFFMLRGFDEGYNRPSFGVYIAQTYSGKGLSSVALGFSMSWCQLNRIDSMMLKVHPENRYAKLVYEKAGFTIVETCLHTGHTIMEKRWSYIE